MRLNGLLGERGFPGYVLVAIGNFADPNFPAPSVAVREESRHPWISLPADMPRNVCRNKGERKLLYFRFGVKLGSGVLELGPFYPP
jgi:hypothetical protein